MTALTMADAFAKAAYAGRDPDLTEYHKASPCDQRAILARWYEIAHSPLTWANTAGPERDARDGAWEKWQRAMFGSNPQVQIDLDNQKDAQEEHENQFLGGGLT